MSSFAYWASGVDRGERAFVNPDTRDKLTFRRRLALLALLHRSPQPYHKIVAALDQQKLFYYDSHADKATVARLQKYQFRYDLRTLKQTGCLIEFDRTSKCYCWRNSPFGLSFNPTQLNALALLCDTSPLQRCRMLMTFVNCSHFLLSVYRPSKKRR